MNIFISGLSFTSTDEDLRQLFAAQGNVSSAKVIIDKLSNRSKGFGFVEMPNKDEAEKAMKQLNGANFAGRNIVVNEARPREERTDNKRSFTNSRW